jgi:hypothetical protein
LARSGAPGYAVGRPGQGPNRLTPPLLQDDAEWVERSRRSFLSNVREAVPIPPQKSWEFRRQSRYLAKNLGNTRGTSDTSPKISAIHEEPPIPRQKSRGDRIASVRGSRRSSGTPRRRLRPLVRDRPVFRRWAPLDRVRVRGDTSLKIRRNPNTSSKILGGGTGIGRAIACRDLRP